MPWDPSAGLSVQIRSDFNESPSGFSGLFLPSVRWHYVSRRFCQRTAWSVRMDVVFVNHDHPSRSGVADNGGSRTNGGVLVVVYFLPRGVWNAILPALAFRLSPSPPGEPRSAFMTACQSHGTRGRKSPPQVRSTGARHCRIHICCDTCHLPHNALPWLHDRPL